jgi:Icc-related predicted phosphoesterase
LGGDLLPAGSLQISTAGDDCEGFIGDYLVKQFEKLRSMLGSEYPRVFLILGNDDPRFFESRLLDASTRGLWEYVHNRRVFLESFQVQGYSYVPPSPFLLKDWERYDVSRYNDPGCVSPEEGIRSIPVSEQETRYTTIQEDLNLLAAGGNPDRAVYLFHAPPYQTKLDRAALDNKMIDGVPLDVHVGSIAIKRFIESHQPLVALHGHIHESARLTGEWRDRIGCTHLFSAAHDGPELALVRFDLEDPESAGRELI